MPDLSFVIERGSPVLQAAAPMMAFRVRIANQSLERIHAIALDCKIHVEAPSGPPTRHVRDRLEELFGEPSRWASATRPMLWARAGAIVKSFSESAVCEIEVPCSFDFNLAATKFFYGVEAASAPLLFEFSGTAFPDGDPAPIAPRTARFTLPMSVWSELMENYYPDSTWLRLPRSVFQRLAQFKDENLIPTWEDVLERLLPTPQEAVH